MTGTDSARSIFVRFLRFGALAWGGPAAQIAMIKRECVDEERWVSDEAFRKTLAVYQILPGPEAHELCVYFGRLRGGKLGGLLAGLGYELWTSAARYSRRLRAVSPLPVALVVLTAAVSFSLTVEIFLEGLRAG